MEWVLIAHSDQHLDNHWAFKKSHVFYFNFSFYDTINEIILYFQLKYLQIIWGNAKLSQAKPSKLKSIEIKIHERNGRNKIASI